MAREPPVWAAARLRPVGAGAQYHFVGRSGAGLGGGAGWELQAPPLLLHGATLMPPHAVNLLLHAHLHLALTREHGTLGALLLQWGNKARTGASPPAQVSH